MHQRTSNPGGGGSFSRRRFRARLMLARPPSIQCTVEGNVFLISTAKRPACRIENQRSATSSSNRHAIALIPTVASMCMLVG